MKKRAKTSFSSNSRNILWALLIVAAAVTVYGIAQAASVSHTPADIQPQGAGSGLDSDLLQGLGSADILAQGGGGKELITWGTAAGTGTNPPLAGSGAPACPAGWTQAYAGYGPYYIIMSSAPVASCGQASGIYQCQTSGTYAFAASASPVCGTSISQASGGTTLANACNKVYLYSDEESAVAYYNYPSCNTCRVCVK